MSAVIALTPAANGLTAPVTHSVRSQAMAGLWQLSDGQVCPGAIGHACNRVSFALMDTHMLDHVEEYSVFI